MTSAATGPRHLDDVEATIEPLPAAPGDPVRELQAQGQVSDALAVTAGVSLLQEGRSQDGIDVLRALPEPLAAEPAVRAALGRAQYAVGHYALAVEAYGNPRSLPAPDRRDRRRAWWRSWGFLPFVRERRSRAEFGAEKVPDDVPPPLVAEARLLARAADQIEAGNLAQATAELRGDGDLSPSRRIMLSRVELERDNVGAAEGHLLEAIALEPGSLHAPCALALLRLDDGRTTQAADGLTEHREQSNPVVRATLGRICRRMGLLTDALDAYGDPRTLSPEAVAARRRLWWLTGGPVRPIREWLRARDRNTMITWRHWTRDVDILGELDWPSRFDPSRIHGWVTGYLQSWAQMQEFWSALEGLIGRVMKVVVLVGTWLTLWLVVGIGVGPAMVAALATCGFSYLVFSRMARAFTWRSVVAKGLIACIVILAAAAAMARFAPAWYRPAAELLFASVGVAAVYILVVGPIRVWSVFRVARFRRNRTRERVLDNLIDLLGGMSMVSCRNEWWSRNRWTWLLEQAASSMERRMPAALPAYDRTTDTRAAERARGAAAALRKLKYRVMAPSSGSWDHVIAIIRKDIIALATGELQNLAWAEPPTVADRRRSRLTLIKSWVKNAAVMAIPLVGVFLVQPVLKLDPDKLDWVKGACLVWALLYLAITVDPTLPSKAEAARSLVATVRDIGRPPPTG